MQNHRNVMKAEIWNRQISRLNGWKDLFLPFVPVSLTSMLWNYGNDDDDDALDNSEDNDGYNFDYNDCEYDDYELCWQNHDDDYNDDINMPCQLHRWYGRRSAVKEHINKTSN